MRTLLIALLLLSAGTVLITVAPEASACAVPTNDPVGGIEGCVDNAVCNVEHLLGLC